MLYINLPVGNYYGWAVCGKNLVRELSKLTAVRYVPDKVNDTAPKDYETDKFIKSITAVPNGNKFNYLQNIENINGSMKYKGSKNVGYMFYEEEKMLPDLVELVKEFDVIATGSEWNSDVVRSHGHNNVVTIHQGVDCEIFKSIEKSIFKDQFVIFSGGKIEPRKAQDLVAYCVGLMQRKHKDVFLIASWVNLFAPDEMNQGNFKNVMSYLIPSQTVLLDIMGQNDMARYIAETDIGLFPNRCEGGTNLVMMEYMACSKPVIANYSTGQKDVLDKDYALLVEGKSDDEIVNGCLEQLEYIYQKRERIEDMGRKAKEAMEKFTWEKTAKEFMKIYNG